MKINMLFLAVAGISASDVAIALKPGAPWLQLKLLLVCVVVAPLEVFDIWFGHVRLPALFHHRHPSRPYSAQESRLLSLYHGRLTRIAVWVMPVTVTLIIWLAVSKAG